jgi:hypothetical protein
MTAVLCYANSFVIGTAVINTRTVHSSHKEDDTYEKEDRLPER